MLSMKNLLYIGNNLSTKTNNLSSIQTLGRLLESEGYQLRYASKHKNKVIRLLDMLWACLQYSRWADAVIIDTYSTQNFYFALLNSQCCRLLRIPYYTSLNGGNLPQRLSKNPKLCGLIFDNARANISPSIYLKEAFETAGYKSIVYIPNTIELKNYPVIEKEYALIKLLWVRSFSKIYNPEMAIHVQKQLNDLGYTTELCMIGPDSDGTLNNTQELAKKLKTHTVFTGKLSKNKWIAKSKDYNIFINTTNFDNAPVSVIEAMALGFPVISTNAGGMPFLITDEEDGLLSPKNDVDAMVKHIIKVFEDEDLRQSLCANARLKAGASDWEKVKTQWHSVLNE